MERVTLGRTGLEVGVAGLGTGGHSRLGLGSGKDEANAVRVVRAALDRGVDFFDTAIAYGTEAVLGRALGADRDRVVLCSKAPIHVRDGKAAFDGPLVSGRELVARVETSLRALGTERIDIYLLHGVSAEAYPQARDRLVPVLEDLKAAGKIGHLGMSERFLTDPGHAMLEAACSDACWDVVMVGYNLLNPSAADRVLPAFKAGGTAVLGSFAVRGALTTPERTARVVAGLIASGEVDRDAVDPDDPLGFLVNDGGAASLTEAAYRYCRHTPGIDVVLTGTGSAEHLAENIAAITAPPLPSADIARARRIFARVRSVTGE